MEVRPVLPETIRTDRLMLRRPHPADVDRFVETQTDAEVRRFLGGPRSEAEVREAAKGSGLLMNEEVPYIWYATKNYQLEYSTRNFGNFPPVDSNGTSPLWNLAGYDVDMGF